MVYNLTGIANSTGLLSFTQSVNIELMGGYFGTLLLASLFVILFLSFIFNTGHAGKSFAGASFICFGLSLFLQALTLVPMYSVWITLSMAALSVALLGIE